MTRLGPRAPGRGMGKALPALWRRGVRFPMSGARPHASERNPEDEVLGGVRRRIGRHRRGQREGEPNLTRQFARVGVLGWLVVIPTLAGVALGRWLDRLLDSGVFFSGALILGGLLLGCWSGWRWMHAE